MVKQHNAHPKNICRPHDRVYLWEIEAENGLPGILLNAAPQQSAHGARQTFTLGTGNFREVEHAPAALVFVSFRSLRGGGRWKILWCNRSLPRSLAPAAEN